VCRHSAGKETRIAIGVYFNFETTALEQYDEVTHGAQQRAADDQAVGWSVAGCLERAARHEESGALGVFWESVECLPELRTASDASPLRSWAPQSEPPIVQLYDFVAS